MTFGEALKKQRLALGLSRAKMAELIHCHPETIYAWETGRRKPSRYGLAVIANLIGVSAEELTGGDDDGTV